MPPSGSWVNRAHSDAGSSKKRGSPNLWVETVEKVRVFLKPYKHNKKRIWLKKISKALQL